MQLCPELTGNPTGHICPHASVFLAAFVVSYQLLMFLRDTLYDTLYEVENLHHNCVLLLLMLVPECHFVTIIS